MIQKPWVVIFTIFATLFLFLGEQNAQAQQLNYHGRIVDGITNLGVSGSRNFRIQVRTPSGIADNCLMYEETQTKTLVNGVFVINLNNGSGVRVDATAPVYTLAQVFSNKNTFGSFNFAGSRCVSTNPFTYTPALTDSRRVNIWFEDPILAPGVWEPLPTQTVGYVPSAIEALNVGGFSSDTLMRAVDAFGAPAVIPALTPGQYTNIMSLATGTFVQNAVTGTAGADFNIAVTPSSSGSILTLNIPSSSSANRGLLLPSDWTTFNNKMPNTGAAVNAALGYVPLSPANNLSDLSNPATSRTNLGLGTAAEFNVSAPATSALATEVVLGDDPRLTGAIVSGSSAGGDLSGTYPNPTVATVGGRTAIEINNSVTDTQAATNAATASTIVKRDASGNSTFNSVNATNFSGNNFYVYNTGNANSVQIVAPTPMVGGNYTLTLPPDVGSPGLVLGTNGAGVTSWVNPSGTSVTAVTASAPLVSSGGFTPNISLAKSTAAADGYLASADWTTFNNKLSTTLATGQAWIGNGSNVAAAQFLNISNIKSTVAGNWFNGGACAAGEILSYSPVTDQVTCSAMTLTGSQVATALNGIMTGDGTITAAGVFSIANNAVTNAKILSLNWSKITSASLPTTIAGYGITDAILTQAGGVNTMQAGTFAARPAANGVGVTNRVYVANDTQEIYYSDGATWTKIGSVNGLGGTVTSVAVNAPLTLSGVATVNPTISLAAATAGVNGYLTSSDFTNFAGKVNRAGDTMTGALNMGGNNITAAGNISMNANKNIQIGAYAADPACTAPDAGKVWYHTPSNSLHYCDGTTVQSIGSLAGVVTGVNGLTGSVNIVLGTTGTDANIVTGSPNVTINLPTSSAANRGLVSSTDWSNFNSKQPGSTELTAVAGIATTGFIKRTGAATYTTVSSIDLTTSVSGILPIANGGTNSATAAGALNNLLPAQAGNANKFIQTDGAGNVTWQPISSVAVTSVTAAATVGNPIVIAGTTTAPTVDIPKATNTVNGYLSSADRTYFAAKLDPANNLSDVSTPSTARTNLGLGSGNSPTFTGATLSGLNTNLGFVRTNGSGVLSTAILSSTDVTTALGYTPSSNALPVNQIFVGSASNLATGVAMSGDATIVSSGVLTLKNTGTAGTVGGSNAIPIVTTDAQGRVTNVTTTTYQDATGAAKGILSVGNNLQVSGGVISLQNATGALTGALTSADWTSFNSKLSTTLPTGQVWVGAAGVAVPQFLNSSNIKSTVAGNWFNTGATCAAGEILSYSSVNDNITCSAMVMTGTQVATALSTIMSGDGSITSAGAFSIANNAVTNAKILSLNWSKITSASLPTTIVGYGITDSILTNAGGVTSMQAGLNAAKPAAGTVGRVYVSTDTQEIYRDDGAAWIKVGSATGSGGTVTNVTATAPISVATGTTTPVISMAKATAGVDGYLSSTDFTTFNSKLSNTLANGNIWVGDAGNIPTAVTVSGDASISNTGALTLATVSTAGTYTKVTIDTKGRVTSATNINSSDVTTALGYTPVNRAGDTMTGALNMGGQNLTNTGVINMASNGNIQISNRAADPVGLVPADAGRTWYNTTTNALKYFDGTTIQTLGSVAGVVTGVNGITGAVTINSGSTGTDLNIANAGSTITVNIPTSSAANRGLLASADFTTFNSKQPGSTELTGIAGLATTGFVLRTGAGAYSAVSSIDLTTSVSGILPIANGGTNSTTANGALNNLLPTQTANANKFLQTNGTNTSWQSISAVAVTSVTAASTAGNPIVIGGTTTAPTVDIPVATAGANGYLSNSDFVKFSNKMSSDFSNATGTLPIANGGTGATTAAAARTNLQLSSADSVTFTGLTVSGVNGNTLVKSSGAGLFSNATSTDVTNLLGFIPSSNALPVNQIFVGNASNVATAVAMSGDASIVSSGTITLKNTGTAGTYGSASAVPTITTDAQGRVTTVTTNAYQDATGVTKGIVSVGNNLQVTGGVISLQNATAAQTGALTSADWTIFSAKQNGSAELTGLAGLSTNGFIQRTGAGTYSTVASVDLTTSVTGTLPVANGGTGITATGANGNVMYVTGGAFATATPDTAGLVDKSSAQTISGAKTLTSALTLNAQNEMRFADSDSSNYISLRSPATVGSNVIFTLPNADGTAGQVLKTDGAGQMSWVSASTGTVTSVTSANADIGVATTTTTPVLTLNSGLGASQIAKVGAVAIANNTVIVANGAGGLAGQALTNGQLLIGSTGAAPVAANITGTANQIAVTNGAGSITLSTPQNIHSGASPTFTGLTLSGFGVAGIVKNSAAGVLSGGNSVSLTTDISGTLPVANGGTGAITADGALTNLLPLQTANAGKVLSTNGTLTSWINVGTVTNVTGTAPISVATGTTTPVISIAKATGAVDGYLSSTDWSLFNGKQNALGYTPVNRAGDTMTGALNLPSNGLNVGGNQLFISGNQVGMGTNSPSKGALLDLDSNGKEFALLVPRMDEATRNNVILDQDGGYIVYNTDKRKLNIVNHGAWEEVATTANTVSSITVGTGMTGGGTGSVSVGVNSELQGLSALAANGFVKRTGAGTYATSTTVSLTADVTGTLPVANGGTGITATGANGNVMYVTGGAFATATPDTAGLVDKSSAQTIAGAKTLTSALTLNAQNEMRFADSDSSNYISLRSPATVGSNVIFTLPNADGTAGQVLKTDGAGQMSWVSASTGTVTSVTSANADIGVATTTTTPVLTLNSGLGASQIAKVGAVAIANNTVIVANGAGGLAGQALTNGQLLIGSTGAAPVVATVGSSNGISLTTGAGTFSIGTNATTATANNTLVMRDGSGVMNANGVGFTNTGTVTVSAAAASATYGLILPGAQGAANTLLKNDGAGNLSWATAGTVTSVSGTAPVSVATGTTTPVISMAKSTAAVDGYLAAADFTIFASKMSSDFSNATGTLPIANGGTGAATAAGARTNFGLGTADSPTFTGLTVSGLTNGFVKSTAGVLSGGNTVSLTADISGTLPVANGGTGAATLTANSLLVGNGTSAVNFLAPTNGNVIYGAGGAWTSGTPDTAGLVDKSSAQTIAGAKTFTTSTIIDNQQEIRFREATGGGTNYIGLRAPAAVAADVTFNLPIADGTAGQVLKTDGAGQWGWVTALTGTVPVTGGGTGLTSGTSGGIPYFASSTTMASSAALTANAVVLGGGAGASPTTSAAFTANGQLLIGNGAGVPSIATLTGTANQIAVTNGAGSITLSTPQDIHSGASPTFTGLTLSGFGVAGIVKNSAAGVLSGGNSVTLTTDVTGTLPVANGGTGATTLTNGAILVGQGTSAVAGVAATTIDNIMSATSATNWQSRTPSSAGVFYKTGNAFGATAVVGTTDAFGVNINTSGSTRMSFDTSGAVQVTGQAYSLANTATCSAGAATCAWDANTSNIMVYNAAAQATPATTITNMKAGGSYMLVLKGSGTGVATITCNGVAPSYVPANGSRVNGTKNKSVYTLMWDGTDCLVTWITGF